MGEFEITLERGRGEHEWCIATSRKCYTPEYIRDYVNTYYGDGEWDFIYWNTIGGVLQRTNNPTSHHGIFTWRLRKEVKDE